MTAEPFTVRDSTNLEAAARILLRLKVPAIPFLVCSASTRHLQLLLYTSFPCECFWCLMLQGVSSLDGGVK